MKMEDTVLRRFIKIREIHESLRAVWDCGFELLILLKYKAIVRLRLEYCTDIWRLYRKKDIVR